MMELPKINLLVYKLLSVRDRSCFLRIATVFVRFVVVKVRDGTCRCRFGPCLSGANIVCAVFVRNRALLCRDSTCEQRVDSVLMPCSSLCQRGDEDKTLEDSRRSKIRKRSRIVTDCPRS
ncbi:hypothetical protein DPMN_078337 [Dreissena polymorpha]|uniref:Uncharacterized protein n=1 Tax=Dreissena polymorpha TaxID=45954 RepID=A0A9D4BHE4_DREPO|nr:hypothetical protein DPMN_078337 [Dreissena polymorpha]